MTERGKVLNPEYNIFRDQPIAKASPLRINTLLYGGLQVIQNTSEVFSWIPFSGAFWLRLRQRSRDAV